MVYGCREKGRADRLYECQGMYGDPAGGLCDLGADSETVR